MLQRILLSFRYRKSTIETKEKIFYIPIKWKVWNRMKSFAKNPADTLEGHLRGKFACNFITKKPIFSLQICKLSSLILQ